MSHSWDLPPALWPDLIDHQHCRRRMVLFKILFGVFFENGRRKRPEWFALLDPIVQDLFHFSSSRINHDGAVAERSWAKLHASLKPSNHHAGSDILSRAASDLCVGISLKSEAAT